MENKTVNDIISNHVGFSMAAGAIPVPLVDIAAVTAVQLDMLAKLAQFYEVDFDTDRGKALVSAIISAGMGSYLGFTLGRIGASLVKGVPFLGTAVGIASQAALSGAATYALGRIFDSHFKGEGDLINFDLDEAINSFASLFKEGEDAIKRKEYQEKEDILETIRKMKEMADQGIITQEEFKKTKKALLDKLKEGDSEDSE